MPKQEEEKAVEATKKVAEQAKSVADKQQAVQLYKKSGNKKQYNNFKNL